MPTYSSKADVWSVGAVVFELLTGTQPFLAVGLADMQAVVQAALADRTPGGHPSFIQDLPLSADCRDFLATVLQQDPALRPTAETLLQHRWLASYRPVQSAQCPFEHAAVSQRQHLLGGLGDSSSFLQTSRAAAPTRSRKDMARRRGDYIMADVKNVPVAKIGCIRHSIEYVLTS